MHRHPVRVYYEDTDLAGIVYYANYLRFIERGRSEWVRARGLDQTALKSGQGIVFAVRRLEADYLKPAQFDDELQITTQLVSLGGARIDLRQEVWRGEVLLFAAMVTLVCLHDNGQPARIPPEVRAALDPTRH